MGWFGEQIAEYKRKGYDVMPGTLSTCVAMQGLVGFFGTVTMKAKSARPEDPCVLIQELETEEEDYED